MKLSEMTGEQKSWWIAEHLQPLSTLPSIQDYIETWGTARSKKYWHPSYDGTQWEAKDMVNDPAMTVMLLESETNGDLGDGYLFLLTVACEWKRTRDIKIAVADTFMLANGWKEDDYAWPVIKDEIERLEAENAKLRQALKESIIRIKDLFNRHEYHTYLSSSDADRDLALILAGAEAALREEK